MIRGTFVFLATFGVVAPASAADLPFGNKGLKIYPKSEAHYIKQFSGPTISPCGPCFGYYRTQWRSWGEACNEPQAVDPGPPKYAPPPEDAIPEPEKKGTPAVPKLDAGPKDPEKKDAPVLPSDKNKPPMPMPMPEQRNPSLPMPDDKKPTPPTEPKIELPKIDVPKPRETKPEAPKPETPKETASVVVPVIELAAPAQLVPPVAPAPLPVPSVPPVPLPTVIVPVAR